MYVDMCFVRQDDDQLFQRQNFITECSLNFLETDAIFAKSSGLRELGDELSVIFDISDSHKLAHKCTTLDKMTVLQSRESDGIFKLIEGQFVAPN